MPQHAEGTVTPPDPDRPAPTHNFKVGDTVRQAGVGMKNSPTFTVTEDRGHTLLVKGDDGTEYEMNPTKLKKG